MKKKIKKSLDLGKGQIQTLTHQIKLGTEVMNLHLIKNQENKEIEALIIIEGIKKD